MEYIKGNSFKDEDNDHKTYGITEIGEETHFNKIEVYGDKKLRNKIIKLLNEEETR